MKSAVFTIVQDEPVFLSVWLQHYSKFFEAQNIHVINHESKPQNYKRLQRLKEQYGFIEQNVFNKVSFDHTWLRRVVADYQHWLLHHYDCVLFVESDELVIPKNGKLDEYIAMMTQDNIACTGWEVVQRDSEAAWYPGHPILIEQRSHWVRNEMWDKPLLSKTPLEWISGFHEARMLIGDNYTKQEIARDDDLLLIHLHRVDFRYCAEKAAFNARKNWSPEALAKDEAPQNRIDNIYAMKSWFMKDCVNWEPIPKELAGLV